MHYSVAFTCMLIIAQSMHSMSSSGFETKRSAEHKQAGTPKKLALRISSRERRRMYAQEDPTFACTGLPKELQALVKEYTIDPLEYARAVSHAQLSINKAHNYPITFITHNRLATGSYTDANVHIWHAGTGESLKVLEGHTGPVTAIAAIGNRIISGSADTTIKVWDTASGLCLHTLEGHKGAIHTILPYQDNLILTASYHDNNVYVWNLTGERVHTFSCIRSPYMQSPVHMMCLINTTLYVATDDGFLYGWNIETHQQYSLKNYAHEHIAYINTIMSPEGISIITSSDDGRIRILDLAAGTGWTHLLNGHLEPLYRIFSISDTQLCSYTYSGEEKTWDFNQNTCIATEYAAENENDCTLYAQFNDGFSAERKANGSISISRMQDGRNQRVVEFTQHNPQDIVTVLSPDKRSICFAKLDELACIELQNLPLQTLEDLQELVAQIDAQQAKLVAARSNEELKITAQQEKFITSLPESIKTCLASHYRAMTTEEESSSCIIQ